MSRITNVFSSGASYVGYLMAGDGGYRHSIEAMLALINGGINILEIGVPFSDPIADGSIIQQAAERALATEMTTKKVFDLVKEIRQVSDIAIVLFSYYNPIYIMQETFYQRMKECNIDACLLVDLPPEESTLHLKRCEQYGIDPIFLVSPSTPLERIKYLNQIGKGMLYYACRNATTGKKDSLPEDFYDKISIIKKNSKLPVVTGFGISTRKIAAQASAYCDGIVIGSPFVEKAFEMKSPSELTQLARSLDPR